MFTVDNSGQGNCMYAAYSISLMYFLRSKNDPAITEAVLSKFGLTDGEKNRLIPLITQNRAQKFSRESIRDIIEPFLATKARALGAQRTRQDFINNPRATGLYTSAQYGLENYFKISLKAHSESTLLTGGFSNRDYTAAEIFKVQNIKTTMFAFTQAKSSEVHARFEEEWNKIKANIKHEDTNFRQTLILDNIIAEKTIEFFSENNYRNLDAYITHLGTNYVWGTEETLMTINRAVQGERFEYNSEGRVDTLYDTVVNLQIHRDNNAPNYQYEEQPDLVLNNVGNYHWTSRIPQYVFDPEKALLEQHALDSQIKADEAFARQLQEQILQEQKRAEEEQIAFDLKIAQQMAADDMAVAELIEKVILIDKNLAEEIAREDIQKIYVKYLAPTEYKNQVEQPHAVEEQVVLMPSPKLSEEEARKAEKDQGRRDEEEHLRKTQEQRFDTLKESIQKRFLEKIAQLNDLKPEGPKLFNIVKDAQQSLFLQLRPDVTQDKAGNALTEFLKTCNAHVQEADALMGHGWLYRAVEVMVKAIVGALVGIGMVIGSIGGQGLANPEYREKFRNRFFALDQSPESKALESFKSELNTLKNSVENIHNSEGPAVGA